MSQYRDDLRPSHPSPSPQGADKLLLKPEEAARLLSIGRSSVYELIGTGEIVSFKIGNLRRIPRGALDDYIAAKQAAAGSHDAA